MLVFGYKATYLLFVCGRGAGGASQQPITTKEVNTMRKRADSLNLTVNVTITVTDGETKKPASWRKPLAVILAVFLSVVVAVALLLAVPGVDPVQCAKIVRTFISTLLSG